MWLETIGDIFIAKKIWDDSYVVEPNRQWINFSFSDFFDEQKDNICSKDLIDFIVKIKLDLTFKKYEHLKKEKNLM